MARLSKIFLGAPFDRQKTREALTAAAIAPGTLVSINGSGQFAAAAAADTGKQLFVVDNNYPGGGQVDDNVPSGDTGIGLRLLSGQEFAVFLSDGQNVTQIGTALKIGATAGELEVASLPADINLVVAHASEIYNNNTGAKQLLAVSRD